MTLLYNHTPDLKNDLLLVTLGLALLLVLLRLPAPALAQQEPATAPTPAALPTATRLPGPEPVRVQLSPWPLHGSPSFTAEFSARLLGQPSEIRTCREVRWDFGDGTQDSRACEPEPGQGESEVILKAQHAYTDPGTYHARVTAILGDGRVEESGAQTVVVAVPQAEPWSRRLVRWNLWALTLLAAAGAFLWLRRLPEHRKRIGYALVALALTAYVPPFSYLPDPVGLVQGWLTGHSYDPRLPFANRFVVAGDPTAELRPWLDGLIGQTGLDPLDPHQPLARYEFMRVSVPRQGLGSAYRAFVATRFTYADGSQRTYEVPVFQPDHAFGFYQAGWRYDGLGRLRTEHRELAGIPFATEDSLVQLAKPEPLNPHPQARQVSASDPASWGPAGRPWQKPAWSPRDNAFLAAQTVSWDRRDLWLIRLDFRGPVRIAENVDRYAWSPGSRHVVFTQFDRTQKSYKIYVVPPTGEGVRELARLAYPTFPGLTDEGVWYASRGSLWLQPYDGSQPQRLATLPVTGTSKLQQRRAQVFPAPDGKRVAYVCGPALCLMDRDGRNWKQVGISPYQAEATWGPDGSRLAVVHRQTSQHPVQMTIVRRDGQIERQMTVAPDGEVSPPQWAPDGGRLFLQTFPSGGRRILTVDVATGEVLDLSRPRWDAWFALSPDGRRLLLSNGRGGFWTSEVVYTNLP